MINLDNERYHLAIPIHDAVFFAMGWSNLGYKTPNDTLRQLIGVFAIDALEYTEQWRAAALLRACLRAKWPESAAY